MGQQEQIPLLVEYCIQQLEQCLKNFQETGDPTYAAVAFQLLDRLREGFSLLPPPPNGSYSYYRGDRK